jgi:hypothetical protein
MFEKNFPVKNVFRVVIETASQPKIDMVSFVICQIAVIVVIVVIVHDLSESRHWIAIPSRVMSSCDTNVWFDTFLIKRLHVRLTRKAVMDVCSTEIGKWTENVD